MSVLRIVLLVLLILLLLILLLRLGGKVEFSEDGLSVRIRVGPVYYRIYPRKRKKQAGEVQPEPPPAAEKSAPAEPEPSPAAEKSAPAEPEASPAAEKSAPAEPEPSPAAEKSASAEPEASAGEKKAQKPKKRPEKRKKTAPSEPSPAGGKLELALKLAPDLLKLAGEAAHRLRVDELTLQYTIAGRWDAAGAAQQYGLVYVTGGVLYPVLAQHLRVKRWQVGAEIDFQEEIPRVYVCLNLSVQVWELLLLGISALKVYWKLKKRP